MRKITLIVAAALMAGAASAQEVGLAVGQLESRETAVSARIQSDIAGPFGTDIEITGDTLVGDNSFNGTLLGANLVKDFDLTNRLSVYALGGLGYAWTSGFDTATYTYGGGVTYDLTDRFQLDGRVREVESFRDNTSGQTIATVGFNVKF